MAIYENDIKNILVRDLYQEFELRYANHPIQFENIFKLDGKIQVLKLDFAPISYVDFKGVYVKLPGEDNFTEIQNYDLDYEQGILKLFELYPAETEVKFIGYYRKINLKQFIQFLNSSIRAIYNDYPIKTIQEIELKDWTERIDLTSLNLLDVKAVYGNLIDKKPLNILRRGKYIYFINNDITPDNSVYNNFSTNNYTDYGYIISIATNLGTKKDKVQINEIIDIDTTNNSVILNQIKGKIYIEGVLKIPELKFNLNIEETLNQSFQWHNDAIEPLLIMIAINMYKWLMHLNTRINVSNLQLDYRYIVNVLNTLTRELLTFKKDSQRNRGLYYTSKSQEYL